MAIWPSSTKASTSNVDSGSDKPRLARADIKQNIDNTNSIIDMFDIASPSDGDILVYNSTNARFEKQAAVFQEAILEVGKSITANDEKLPITSTISDPNSIAPVSSGGFTLGVGTYLIWCWTRNGSGTTFDLRDPDGDPNGGGPYSLIQPQGSPINDGLMFFDKLEVVGSSNYLYIKHSSYPSGPITLPNSTFLRIVKVA